jgi:hypothetical protein
VLEPAKIATQQLSYKSNNLVVAEATINFLLDALIDQNTPLADKFYNSFRSRIEERRNNTLINLIMYLRNPDVSVSDRHFKAPTKAAIQKLGVDLLKQYFVKDAAAVDPVSTSSTSPSSTTTTPSTSIARSSHSISLHERLQQSLNQYTTVEENPNLMPDNMKREFTWFDRNKKRTPLLDKLLSALLTIQPTSTQSERNFSISNNVLTKQRKRLLDKHLNAIVFVKSHFINN